MDKIQFTEEDGTIIDFYVLEQTRISNRDYLLVTDSQEDDAQAYIMKDISAHEDDQACYEFVEDDLELEAVSEVFRQTLEEIELE